MSVQLPSLAGQFFLAKPVFMDSFNLFSRLHGTGTDFNSGTYPHVRQSLAIDRLSTRFEAGPSDSKPLDS